MCFNFCGIGTNVIRKTAFIEQCVYQKQLAYNMYLWFSIPSSSWYSFNILKLCKMIIDCYGILVIHIWFFCVNIVKFIEIIFKKNDNGWWVNRFRSIYRQIKSLNVDSFNGKKIMLTLRGIYLHEQQMFMLNHDDMKFFIK